MSKTRFAIALIVFAASTALLAAASLSGASPSGHYDKSQGGIKKA
jgi:hypothetical protein